MIKQLYNNDHYKVMEVSLNSGEGMSKHKATSDAFLIVQQGTGKIIFSDDEIEVQQGSTVVIPADKEHSLEVYDLFLACVIFPTGAGIKFL